MIKQISSIISVMAMVILSTLNGADLNTSPWLFNVYAIDSIGTSNSAYGSDFQGVAGAGNNAYFSGFSLNDVGYANTAYSLYTGGSSNFLSGAVNHGGIEAGGLINLNATSVNGNVSGGGNLTTPVGGGGTINGNVKLAGTNQAGPGLTINGTVTQNTPFTPTVNLNAVSTYFKNASTSWGALASTVTYNLTFGLINVSALQAGLNVLNISASQFASAYGLSVAGASNAYLVINIADSNLSSGLNNLTYYLSGGLTSNNLALNLPNATSILLSNGEGVSVIAPYANITYPSGVVIGNLIANNLTGSGQVNAGYFSGFQPAVSVPEPTAYLLMGTMLLFSALAVRRKKTVAS